MIARRARRLIAALIVIATLIGVSIALGQEDEMPPGPLQGSIIYTLRYGDVLDLIGARYDVSVACILQVNRIANARLLRAGDQILLTDQCPRYDGFAPVLYPRAGAPSAAPEPSDTGTTAQTGIVASTGRIPLAQPGELIYTLHSGDLLASIAAWARTELVCILDRNAAETASAFGPGDTIIIPSTCTPRGGPVSPEDHGVGPAAEVTPEATVLAVEGMPAPTPTAAS